VIDGCGYYVLFLITIKLRNTFESKVIALCGSAGENYFFALSTYHVTDMASCRLTGYFRIPSELVRFGVGISEIVG
jgi:hypothetical protein